MLFYRFLGVVLKQDVYGRRSRTLSFIKESPLQKAVPRVLVMRYKKKVQCKREYSPCLAKD
jgi:hypothetical protein